MRKSFLRAAVIACLPFCAMALTVTATPAQAADKDKDKAEAPKASKSISKLMVDANKASEAKDYKTVVEKCLEAEKTADLTDADWYYINRFLGVAYLSLGDRDKARENIIKVVKNPVTPVGDRKFLTGPAMSLAAEVNDNATVIELGKIALADGTDNPEVLGTLAGAYYQTGDYANAIVYSQKGVDATTAKGQIPLYGLYQVLAYSYDKQKNRPAALKTFELMARDYGKGEDWRYLLDLSLEALPPGNKQSREIAALDIYRLRVVVDAVWVGTNYQEAEDSAHAIRSWGDSRTFIQMGIDKGVIDRAKAAPLLNQVSADARKDEPILPTVEKSAKGKDLANVAEAYYGYGRYADASRAAKAVIAAGGPAAGEAQLVLAMSQVRLGDEAGATQTLANYQGDAPLTRAADLWKIYLTRRYGKTAAAAPAAH